MPTLYDLLPPDVQKQYRPDALDPKARKLLESDAAVLTPDQQAEFVQLAPRVMPKLTMTATIGRIEARHPAAGVAPPPPQQLEGGERRRALITEGLIGPFSNVAGIPALKRRVQARTLKEGLAQGALGIPATMAMSIPITEATAGLGLPAVATNILAGARVPIAAARAIGATVPSAAANAALLASQPGTARQRLARAAVGTTVGAAGEALGPLGALAGYGVAQPEAISMMPPSLGGEGRPSTAGELAQNVAIAGLMTAHPLAQAVARRFGGKSMSRTPAAEVIEPEVERVPRGVAGELPEGARPAGLLPAHRTATELPERAGVMPPGRRLGARVIPLPAETGGAEGKPPGTTADLGALQARVASDAEAAGKPLPKKWGLRRPGQGQLELSQGGGSARGSEAQGTATVKESAPPATVEQPKLAEPVAQESITSRAEAEVAAEHGSLGVSEAEARANPSRPPRLGVGDFVSIPNKGRGLAARERGRVASVDEQKGTMLVAVTRNATAKGKGSVAHVEVPIASAKSMPRMGARPRAERVERRAASLQEAKTEDLIGMIGEHEKAADAIFEEHRGMPERGSPEEAVKARGAALAKRRQFLEKKDAVVKELYRRGLQPSFENRGEWFRGGSWGDDERGMMANPFGELKRLHDMGRARIAAAEGGAAPAGGEKGTAEPPPPDDAVAKLLKGVREAKPAYGQQERMRTKERGRRAAAAEAAGAGLKGEARSRARLRHFGGELPAMHFEAVKLDKATVGELHDRINESPKLKGEFDRATAVRALDGILGEHGGSVPAMHELRILQRVFGEDLVRELIQKSPMKDKLLQKMADYSGLMKSLRSMGDFSAGLRQGLVLGAGNPKRFAQAFRAQFKYFASPEAFEAAHERIASHPKFQLAQQGGVDFTEHGALSTTERGGREEQFTSPLAERLGETLEKRKLTRPFAPLGHAASGMVRASERAYTGFLNHMRMDAFSDMVDHFEAAGEPVRPLPGGSEAENAARAARLKKIGDWINDATGRGGLGKLEKHAALLNTLMFSPRLQASRIALMNPKKYLLDTSPQMRREAAKSAINLLGAVSTMLGLAVAAGATVELDPRSSDFAKAKVGNTRFDLLGGFQQYVRYVSVMASGAIKTQGKLQQLDTRDMNRWEVTKRFARSKASPAAGLAMDLLSGYDSNGKKIERPDLRTMQEFVPLVWQDLWDASKEWGPAGLMIAAPSIFGVGVQTYGGKGNKIRDMLNEEQSSEPEGKRP